MIFIFVKFLDKHSIIEPQNVNTSHDGFQLAVHNSSSFIPLQYVNEYNPTRFIYARGNFLSALF